MLQTRHGLTPRNGCCNRPRPCRPVLSRATVRNKRLICVHASADVRCQGRQDQPASRRQILHSLLFAGSSLLAAAIAPVEARAEPGASSSLTPTSPTPSSTTPPLTSTLQLPSVAERLAPTVAPAPASPQQKATPLTPPTTQQAAPSSQDLSTSSRPATPPLSAAAQQSTATTAPLDAAALSDETARRLLQQEEGRRKKSKGKGRLRELEEIRFELAEKELALLQKQVELLEKDQTLAVLKEELELERKLRALLTKEKDRAEEEAALATGLCTGGAMLP